MKAKRSRNEGAIWCDRRLLESQFIGLCKTECQFHSEIRRLGISKEDAGHWTQDGDGARTHFFNHPRHGRCAIVCINHRPGRTRHQINALLAHEAVHIWQSELRNMGETCPGDEIEAYAIQSIVQGLMVEYWGQS